MNFACANRCKQVQTVQTGDNVQEYPRTIYSEQQTLVKYIFRIFNKLFVNLEHLHVIFTEILTPVK